MYDTVRRMPIRLTHWGRVTHICAVELTTIGSDNGLSPGRRQAIIWNNAGILLIGPLGTNFNEILIEIQTFSFKKMHLKISSGKWRLCCLGLNVLNGWITAELLACWPQYRKVSNIRCTKSQYLNDSRLVLQLSLPNPMKSGVKSRMKMQLEQRRQAMLQLHLNDQQFNCLLRCVLY